VVVPQGDEESAETVVCTAEAIFDFALDEGDSEVHYVKFSVGDKIHVFEMEEEWWFGEVNGDKGFFPNSYVKKL